MQQIALTVPGALSECYWSGIVHCRASLVSLVSESGLALSYECAIESIQISNATSCLDCARGRYQNVIGQASCLPCIPGEFQNETGKTECKPCAEGTASDKKNRTTPCDACAPGSHSTGNAPLHAHCAFLVDTRTRWVSDPASGASWVGL